MEKVREKRPRYTYGDSSTYEGEWIDDQRDGFGFWTGANEDKYEGQFKENKFHGLGSYNWKVGGLSYVGYWVNSVC